MTSDAETTAPRWKKVATRKNSVLSTWILQEGNARIASIIAPCFQPPSMRTNFSGLEAEFCYDLDEIRRDSKIIVEQVAADKTFLGRIADACRAYCDAWIGVAKRASAGDLSAASKEQLVAHFNRYREANLDYSTFLYIMFPVEQFLTDRVKSQLRGHFSSASEQELEQHFRTATIVQEDSDFYREQQELLGIATRMFKTATASPETAVLMDNHVQKFGWMGLGNSLAGEPWAAQHFLASISPAQKLKELVDQRSAELAKRAAFMASLPAELAANAELLQRYMLLRAYRIDTMKKAQLAGRPLLHEIARRIGIDYDDLIWLTPAELVAALKGADPPRNIDQRRHCSIVNIKSHIFFAENEQPSIVPEQTKLTGTVASPGIVEGIVKIVRDARDLHKLQQGDVLVTPMTVPDMVIGMQKAAAIVTDEGGILCHAAIVSRELGIPCVIATEIATKVFRDGDRVKVDANRGVIEKV